ncbi:MAG TPA: gamma-glutamyltransferase, partial [Aestuariivirga sp.]|nr:gamma-glutamyltransferase [Aestuariivirga sp.]
MLLIRPTILLFLLLISAGPASAFMGQPVTAENGMVVTSQKIASDVGVDILKQGGNAIDAAVAVGYALAVVHPCCGNLGGGGFATLHLADGRDLFLNFRERAPYAATETMYLDDKGEVIKGASLRGYLAVGVPGTVMGLDTLLEKYGSLPRDVVMAPAIKLAEEGYVLDQGDADILARGTEAFAAEPNVVAIFLKDGKPYQAGDRLVQKQLAATLRMISAEGSAAFYNGPFAEKLAYTIHDHGGIISPNDLASYRVTEDPPVRCTYRGYEIISSPPPSSGGTTICLILNILEDYKMAELGWNSAQGIHDMVEAMRHAFVDRNFLLGDPEFVDNPLNKLLSKDYAAEIRTRINPDKASTSEEVQPGVPPHEGTQTTHFSVVDARGNAIGITYTINAYFGAKVIAGDTGFFLNDEMDDFTIKPGVANMFGLVQGKANAIAPGKRPLSSMSPTIVKK